MIRKRSFVAMVLAFIIWLSGHSFAQSNDRPRYFTVRDSIEMSRFVDRENPTVTFSPNHRYFAIVTSRGVIRSNAIESTLWIFDAEAVERFVTEKDKGSAHLQETPSPRALVRFSAVPLAEYPDSYEPIISDTQWLPNSKGLLYLAQNARGERQLYGTATASGSTRALTPAGQNVTRFSLVHGTLVYQVAADPYVVRGQQINAGAFDVTGLSFAQILYPIRETNYDELWTIRNGRNTPLLDSANNRPLRVLSDVNVLSIAPDGKSLAILLPVHNPPGLWKSYLRGGWMEGEAGKVPTEYVRVNLQTAVMTPFIDAPNGTWLGNYDGNSAAWSPTGRQILLTNTYLPLGGVHTPTQRQRRSCAAVVVNLGSRAFTCVITNRWLGKTGKNAWLVMSGSFASENEIVLKAFRLPSTNVEERYRERGGVWEFVGTKPLLTRTTCAISITVKQDMNDPPILWATDMRTNVSKRLWDPNPQLRTMNLGDASVIRWRDASGYEWIAGLVKPPNYVPGKRYPLVIQTHGFIQDEFMSDGEYTTAFAARPLASVGIMVLQMPINWDHFVTPQEVPDQIRGFKSAIALLDAQGLIDPNRVGIIGFSRTCYHVESALIANPTLFAAASVTDGFDASYIQTLFYFFDSPGESDAINGGSPFGSSLASWVHNAPGFNLNRIQTPLLITALSSGGVAGEWEMYASLRMQKKPVDLMYLLQSAGHQHILQTPLDRLASQQGNVDWFRFWLQGYEDPNPAKRAQYRRWEGLRKLEGQLSRN